MYRFLVLCAVLLLSACGSEGDEGSTPEAGDPTVNSAAPTESTDGGGSAEAAAPGTATFAVEGQEWTLTEPGAVECSITAEAVTFSYRIGDNEVTLGGGANHYDQGWIGAISLRVAEPQGEERPISYFPDLDKGGDGLVAEDGSMTYDGPMLKSAADPANPEPQDAGDGTISAACG